MKKMNRFLVSIALISMMSCTWWGNNDDDLTGPYKSMSAQQLFLESEQALKKGEYTTAINQLEALESMYPFSRYAEKAQMNLIYAYYKKEDFASAAATSERFIHLYPRASHVDYAYYMKGLANFQQVRGSFATVLPLDESWRDPGTQAQSYNDFSLLIQRFPNSRYKANALQRMIYLRNMFAQKQLNIAKFYFERKMYVAAIERANQLIKTYPQAPSAKEALVIMYRANRALGLEQAAKEAQMVYAATYHQALV